MLRVTVTLALNNGHARSACLRLCESRTFPRMDRAVAEGDAAGDEVLCEENGVTWYEKRVPGNLAPGPERTKLLAANRARKKRAHEADKRARTKSSDVEQNRPARSAADRMVLYRKRAAQGQIAPSQRADGLQQSDVRFEERPTPNGANAYMHELSPEKPLDGESHRRLRRRRAKRIVDARATTERSVAHEAAAEEERAQTRRRKRVENQQLHECAVRASLYCGNRLTAVMPEILGEHDCPFDRIRVMITFSRAHEQFEALLAKSRYANDAAILAAWERQSARTRALSRSNPNTNPNPNACRCKWDFREKYPPTSRCPSGSTREKYEWAFEQLFGEGSERQGGDRVPFFVQEAVLLWLGEHGMTGWAKHSVTVTTTVSENVFRQVTPWKIWKPALNSLASLVAPLQVPRRHDQVAELEREIQAAAREVEEIGEVADSEPQYALAKSGLQVCAQEAAMIAASDKLRLLQRELEDALNLDRWFHWNIGEVWRHHRSP